MSTVLPRKSYLGDGHSGSKDTGFPGVSLKGYVGLGVSLGNLKCVFQRYPFREPFSSQKSCVKGRTAHEG